MPLPLVSVVLAVRDDAAFVGDALDSALAQTYSNLEVIVVDDGSRDATPEIVATRAARDSRVRVVRQPPLGVAAARNRGIGEARGEFVAPLDGDDVWDPEKIERQVAAMRQAGPAAGLAYCWWIIIDADGHVLDRCPNWTFGGRAADVLLHVNYTGNASVPLFRRSFLVTAGGYDEQFRRRGGEGTEDWDVALRIAEVSDVVAVPALLVAYRRRPGGMSTRVRRMWRSHGLLVDKVRRRRPGVTAAMLRRSRAQFALHLAGVSFWSGRYLQATGWLLRAMPSVVVFRMLPHLCALIPRRLSAAGRAVPMAIEAGTSFCGRRFPAPLMPYDEVYQSSR